MSEVTFESKVRAALERMRSDKRLKRTVVNLAKLVDCSTGTLYNHQWPATELQKLKLEARAPGATAAPKKTTAVKPHAFNAELSDKEIMQWKRKCDKLSAENKSLNSRLEELREQIQALTNEAASGGNVRSLSAKRGRPPEPSAPT